MNECKRIVLLEVDDSYANFGRRFRYEARHAPWYVILCYFGMQYAAGWSITTAASTSLIAAILLLRAFCAIKHMLLRITLDEANGMVEIETLRYSRRQVHQFAKERVKIAAMLDFWGRGWKANMIRIDVDRKTFFTQKECGPWDHDKFAVAEKIPGKL